MFKKPQIKTLITTVGTSLYSNLERLDTDKNPEYADIKEKYLDIKNEKTENGKLAKAKELVKLLLNLSPDTRLLGAEINSVYAMLEKGFLDEERERIIFFISDTYKGTEIGRILQNYFMNSQNRVNFKSCEIVKIEGLQDEKPNLFKTKGLTNLVRQMGQKYSLWQGSRLGINATGGYKAQIAMATAFGQVMQVPVFYKHEFFNQVISFPRVPFTINLSLVEKHIKFWADLSEEGATFTREDLDTYNLPDDVMEEIAPLLEEVEIEEKGVGNKLYSLSPLGQIYWQRFKRDNPYITIEPSKIDETDRLGCTFRDDHYPIGFKEYVRKVYNKNKFIKSCHSLTYKGQKSIENGRFYEYNKKHIVGEYKDRNGFGARFEVVTNANNELERKWVIKELGQ